MPISSFDLLHFHHDIDPRAEAVSLTAPDATVYPQRPEPLARPLSEASSTGTTDTFTSDFRCKSIVSTFERINQVARGAGDSDEILRLTGPDLNACDDAQIAAYRTAVDAGHAPPEGVALAEIWVRRGALRAFIAEQRTRQIFKAMARWDDVSPSGLKTLDRVLEQIGAMPRSVR